MKGNVRRVVQDGEEGFLVIFGDQKRFFPLKEWGEIAEDLARTRLELWQKGKQPERLIFEPRPERDLLNQTRGEIEDTSSPRQENQIEPLKEEKPKAPRSLGQDENGLAQASRRQSRPVRVKVCLDPEGRHYEASYSPEPGKREARIFSIQKLGKDEAFRAACRQRQRWEAALRRKGRT